jgi:ketosteroid isomerase-like protein
MTMTDSVTNDTTSNAAKTMAAPDGRAIAAADLRRAIEGRDAKALAALYADDALLRIIDCDHPPSRPREIKGRDAIVAYFDDVCGRPMSHRVEAAVADGQALAFTQACTYPDGTKVFCAAMLDIVDGRIVRQTAVQAWDA